MKKIISKYIRLIVPHFILLKLFPSKFKEKYYGFYSQDFLNFTSILKIYTRKKVLILLNILEKKYNLVCVIKINFVSL